MNSFNDLVNSGAGNLAMQYGAAQLGGVSDSVTPRGCFCIVVSCHASCPSASTWAS